MNLDKPHRLMPKKQFLILKELDKWLSSGKHVYEISTPLDPIFSIPIFDPKHRMWVLVSGGCNMYSASMFLAKIFIIPHFSIDLNPYKILCFLYGQVFIMSDFLGVN